MTYELLIAVLPFLVTTSGFLLVLGTLSQISIMHKRSLSQHIAKSRQTIAQGMFFLTLACFFLMWWTWLIDVSWLLKILLVLTAISYFLTGIVPYGESRRRDQVHDVAAEMGLFVMLGANLLFAHEFGGVAGVVAAVAAAIETCIIILLIVTKPGKRQFMLVGQTIFFTVFLATIVAVGVSYA